MILSVFFYMSMSNKHHGTALNKEKSSTPFKPIQKTPTIEIEQRKPVFNPVEVEIKSYTRPPRTNSQRQLEKVSVRCANALTKRSPCQADVCNYFPFDAMIDAPLAQFLMF